MKIYPPLPEPAAAARPAIDVERWPTETPLLVLVALASAAIWLMLAVTIIGFVYVIVIGLVLFFMHLAFITHLRGSAVRLGPRQFPALYRRAVELAGQAGLEKMPEIYMVESGGSLNALATKFFRSRMVVLYSDLLEACGDDHAARDMVIGHELGHLKAGHLDWHLALLPGALVPFLGAAWSRAREHTCDRWGAALCGDTTGAVRGLAILAAGGTFGPQVDLAAYAAQERDLDTGWMTLGRWLDPYPPLAVRVSALEPRLAPVTGATANGPLRAIGILTGFALVPTVAVGLVMAFLLPAFRQAIGAGSSSSSPSLSALGSFAAATEGDDDEPVMTPLLTTEQEVRDGRLQVERDFVVLEKMARGWRSAHGQFPTEGDLVAAWERFGAGGETLTDPFDAAEYGYYLVTPQEAVFYSSGPDAEAGTDDDIELRVRPEA